MRYNGNLLVDVMMIFLASSFDFSASSNVNLIVLMSLLETKYGNFMDHLLRLFFYLLWPCIKE